MLVLLLNCVQFEFLLLFFFLQLTLPDDCGRTTSDASWASQQARQAGKRAKGADGWQSCLFQKKLISASPASSAEKSGRKI